MKQTAAYKPEIDGLRGIACLIVLMGHSVACIFPAIYFGNSYQQHSSIEAFVHGTPLNLLFNGSAMVMIFFIISGYLMNNKSYKSLVDFAVKRYIRYLSMVMVGITLSAFVMYCHAVNSLRLAEYSYAGKYVDLYNNFTPAIFGKDGVIFEALVKVFLVGSDYNSVLWYISVAFLGDITFAILLDFLNEKRCKKAVLSIVTVSLWCAGVKIWQLQYVSGMAMGILIADLDVELDEVKSWCCFIIGILLLSFEDKGASGIYAPIQYISKEVVPIWCLGGGMALLGILENRHICNAFRINLLKWFGKYSFAIYALQWPIIISVSCGSCLLFYKAGVNYSFAGVGGILIGAAATVGLAVLVQNKLYAPLYKGLMTAWHNIYRK